MKAERPRWRWMLEYTVLCAVLSFIVWPMLTCGCHFHPSAPIFALYPILWGFIMLGMAKERSEKIIGWIAFGFSVLAMWAEFDANSQFLVLRLWR